VAAGLQNEAKSPNLGSIVSVRGGVVDVRFDRRLPPIFSVLHAGTEGKIIVEVMAQLDSTRVRGIALTPTEGLARGMQVEDSGKPLEVPVGKEIMSRMFDVFGSAIDRKPPPQNVQWRTIHRSVRQSPRFSKRVSRQSMCSCHWSVEARLDCSVVRASGKLYFSLR
jgi:F-type H+-transporting ATPase subunit beta